MNLNFKFKGTASGSQWARCLSRDRLRNITNGSLTCIFNYCNYLCMQEFYDLKAGEIYSDCQCTSEQLKNVDKSRPDIDDLCYKPVASDCSWYDRCFTRRYPNCSESTPTTTTNNSSPGNSLLEIAFKKQFCTLADQNHQYLTDYARQWMDQVRKCFLDKLTPLIRPWSNEECGRLESEAMNSISPCFLKPDLTALTSICQLDCKSWWLLFRDIKNFFPTPNYKSNRILRQYFRFGVKGKLKAFFFV